MRKCTELGILQVPVSLTNLSVWIDENPLENLEVNY